MPVIYFLFCYKPLKGLLLVQDMSALSLPRVQGVSAHKPVACFLVGHYYYANLYKHTQGYILLWIHINHLWLILLTVYYLFIFKIMI